MEKKEKYVVALKEYNENTISKACKLAKVNMYDLYRKKTSEENIKKVYDIIKSQAEQWLDDQKNI